MILEMHISNLAVIKDTTLSFDSSYVALLGETGAGKSLIVDALNLLRGEKADYSLIRDQEKKAVVSALFHLDESFLEKHPSLTEFVNREEGTLLLKRTITKDRVSKYSLNDEPLSLNHYREVISHLIDIHSQGENWELFNEKRHLYYLDRFGKKSLLDLKEDYQKAYGFYQDRKKELQTLLSENEELDRDYLSFQIAEIEKYELKENEIEDLNDEYLALRDSEKLSQRYQEYRSSLLLPEGNLKDLLLSLTSKLAPFQDSVLKEETERLKNAIFELSESMDSFEEEYHNLDIDPKRMDAINSRLFALKGLMRKYGKTSKEILDKLKDYKEKLTRIEDFDSERERLEKEIEKAKTIAFNKAKLLSEKRQRVAKDLAKAIGNEMKDLGLPKDGFLVSFKEKELDENGIDDVSFLVRLNAGLDFASLKKASSGGENSRLMLSLKVVLNALDPYDLLVFDEIDTGVSGKIASLIAKKIKAVSSSSQVLVISHLPQVVSSCTSSLFVKKEVKDNMTYTSVRVLEREECEYEVAKMLSGDKVTKEALLQAQKLFEENQGS